MQPLFSIITVTFNAADVIGPTLDSVSSQSCTDYEYIVMDGASTDGTLTHVNRASISDCRIISEHDRGIYDAMNKAMSIARGKYLIFLNAGDSFHSSDTLELIAETIRANDYPGIVYGQTDIVGPDRRKIADRHLRAPEHLTLQSFSTGMVVCHQAFVVLARLASPYNLSFRLSADYDWCIRCLQVSRRNVYIPATLIDYLQEGMTTRHRRASLTERFRIMCRYYGVIPTIIRHLGFLPRFLLRRRIEKRQDSDNSTSK